MLKLAPFLIMTTYIVTYMIVATLVLDHRKRMPRWLSWLLVPMSWAEQAMSGCSKCGWRWSIVKSHVTKTSGENGYFALCEHCWESLGPEERLAYYIGNGSIHAEQSPEVRESIRQAVLAGK